MKNRQFSAVLVAMVWLMLTAFLWFGPRQDISDAERRKLEQCPELTLESVETGRFMTRFESFTQDQFPLRDGFRRMKAMFTFHILRQKDNHGIYLHNGQAAKLEYPLKESSVSGAVKKFQGVYDLYLKDNCSNIVFSVVPDKGYYLADQAGVPAMDYEKLFSAMKELKWAKYADITDALGANDYYSTDTHWRQEKLIPSAGVIAKELGIPEPKAEQYELAKIERPFYGVYYGQAALPMEPDDLYVMENDVLQNCTVTNLENQSVGQVYDRTRLQDRDLYDVFLSGSVSVLTVNNPSGTPGRELVVFRDSFGSSLVPLLVDAYETVTLVDIRYVPTSYVSNFVDFHGQDILFLYSTTVLNNSAMLR